MSGGCFAAWCGADGCYHPTIHLPCVFANKYAHNTTLYPIIAYTAMIHHRVTHYYIYIRRVSYSTSTSQPHTGSNPPSPCRPGGLAGRASIGAPGTRSRPQGSHRHGLEKVSTDIVLDKDPRPFFRPCSSLTGRCIRSPPFRGGLIFPPQETSLWLRSSEDTCFERA